MRRVLLTLALGLCACGGSGGGDGADESFAGTWDANFDVTKNTCNLDLGAGFGRGVVYLVNQNGANVAVENVQSNFSLNGGADSENNSFQTGTTLPIDCGGFAGSQKLSLSFVRSSSDRAAAILGSEITCGAQLCEIVAVGGAERR